MNSMMFLTGLIRMGFIKGKVDIFIKNKVVELNL